MKDYSNFLSRAEILLKNGKGLNKDQEIEIYEYFIERYKIFYKRYVKLPDSKLKKKNLVLLSKFITEIQNNINDLRDGTLVPSLKSKKVLEDFLVTMRKISKELREEELREDYFKLNRNLRIAPAIAQPKAKAQPKAQSRTPPAAPAVVPPRAPVAPAVALPVAPVVPPRAPVAPAVALPVAPVVPPRAPVAPAVAPAVALPVAPAVALPVVPPRAPVQQRTINRVSLPSSQREIIIKQIITPKNAESQVLKEFLEKIRDLNS